MKLLTDSHAHDADVLWCDL